ncbi:major head protein [Bacillus phage vB_Bpu_PumA1]|uniref:Major head protein n=1 Tax=Bacillus phage vB_Bpu_PumA1 TaxID=2662127 RepID=A0A5Q2WDR0_9CAUD|nr:major head protein [Bacillus phage vB_Bpu_PumA1]QGH74206.1 major head protein [Bacillus phage vB_Bpu_PumA1]
MAISRSALTQFKETFGADTFDIINAIKNESPKLKEYYKDSVNAENIARFGAGLQNSQTLQNEFVTALVDRIAFQILRETFLINPLGKFKTGAMPYGRKIEESFVDITKEHEYDPEEAETTLFKRNIPDVKTLFHEVNRKGRFEQTIQEESLLAAFTNGAQFDSFLSQIINSIYNSSEVQEFLYMKLLIDNYYSKGLFKVVKVPPLDTEANLKKFVELTREHSLNMTLSSGSREYNAMSVHTRTNPDDLHLIITNKLRAKMDVNVLASAFNMNKTDFLGSVTSIDKFGVVDIQAVLVDANIFMIYDQVQKMVSTYNPKGLYWNYFFHVWQLMSMSRFHNAVAFVSGDVDAVTQVIVDPPLSEAKQNAKVNFTAHVRTTDDKTYTPVWSVETPAGVELDEGTEINQKGVLTVGANQEGQVTVKATVTYKDTDGTTDKTQVGIGEVIIVRSFQADVMS